MKAPLAAAYGAPRLRVFAVSNLFPSPVEPHRATYNRQQFAALARTMELRVAVPVFWHQWRPGRFPDACFDGVPASYFPFCYPPRALGRLHGPAMSLSLLAAQLRAARRFAPHVILASWLHPDAYGAASLARRLRVPLVVKVHGSDANVLSQVPARRAQIKRVLGVADAVVAVSAALRARLLELGSRSDTTFVVYNGVDRILFQPGDRAQAKSAVGLDPAGRYVLYVGNLKIAKGCEDLLRAVAAIADRIEPEVRFVFAGSGPDSARLAALANTLGLAARVNFVGTLAHAALPQWYRAADLVCLPSHNEGVPNVLLEAMACGVPVIATRVGGVPEVVPAVAGVLVEPHDMGGLADALIVALQRAWPTQEIAAYAARFDWQSSADALGEVLARVVAGDPGSVAALARSVNAAAENPLEVTSRDAASG